MQNKYEILSVIGEGSYGIVYKCRNRETNEIVAVKKFKDNTDISGNKSLMRELKSLKIFNHKNIINFRESFKKKGSYFFVFDFIEKNLLEFLTDYPDGIEPNLIKHIMFQICSGIRQIHNHKLAHRDIKPENILIDRMHKVKICDFGFTRLIEKNSNEYLTEYVATRWYRAPELLIGDKNYGLEIDYWSVGCIMGELIDGNPIFPGENDMEQIYMIYKICGKDSFSYEQIQIIEKKHNIAAAKVEKTKYINPLNNSEISIEINLDKRYSGKISREALSFLKRLLDPNPRTRIKSDEIFDHPYLLNYYQIYAENNEIYVNNFDNNNNFIKKGQNTAETNSIQKGSNNNIKKEMNTTKKMESTNSNGFYPTIKNNKTSMLNNTNNLNQTKQSNRNNNDPNSRNPNNSKTNNNNYKKHTNIKIFGPILENFFENMDSNSYEDLGNYNSNDQINKQGAFGVGKESENNSGIIDKNSLNSKEQPNVFNNINNEALKKEISEKPSNNEDLNTKLQKKNKGISLEKPKIETLNPLVKSTIGDFHPGDDLRNIKLNNYNIEGVKPPNKEERNNYNYYNNIKLYNEDLFEKTGKIKASINPYESIYKITSQIKKENNKKVRKEKENRDKEKDKSNPSSTYSGNTNKTNNYNATKSNFSNNKSLNNYNSISLVTNKDRNKENNINTINILSVNPNEFSPISENHNINISTNCKNNEKHFNNHFKISMNFEKNKIFLSPQKNDVTSTFFFSNGNSRTNNFSSNDPSSINNGNFNYGSLMNYNLNDDKGLRSNNNNNSMQNEGFHERHGTNNNDFTGKSLEQKSKHNILNKSNGDNKFTIGVNFSPDSLRNGKVIFNNQSMNMANITSMNKIGHKQTITGDKNTNNMTKTNKLSLNNVNVVNSNDFGLSKSISLNKNANIKINTNRESNHQINDYLKNIMFTNNFSLGLSSVRNADMDHKRFNSLNSQNHFLIGADDNKKSTSLQKLHLPIIAKKEMLNKVK